VSATARTERFPLIASPIEFSPSRDLINDHRRDETLTAAAERPNFAAPIGVRTNE
jgi:hypothetical protein